MPKYRSSVLFEVPQTIRNIIMGLAGLMRLMRTYEKPWPCGHSVAGSRVPVVSETALDAYVQATEADLECSFSSAKNQLPGISVPTVQHCLRSCLLFIFRGRREKRFFWCQFSDLFPGNLKKKKSSRQKPVLNYTLSHCVQGEEDTTEIEQVWGKKCFCKID